MAQRVEMADVVALDLEAGVVAGAGRQDVLDVGERVLEHARLRTLEIRFLPVVLELALVARDHRIQPEVHRAHVERGDLRLEGCGRTHALLGGHGRRAAGGDVHHHVGALLDDLEEWREGLGRLVRTAVLRIAGMQMDDSRAGFGCPDGGIRDLRGGDGDVRRHRGRMDRAGNSTGNDDFSRLRHELSIPMK